LIHYQLTILEVIFLSKVTTIDIARLAGVSPSAVSLALNGKPGISDKTRTHIRNIVKQTGYLHHAPGKLNSSTANIALLFRNEFPLQDRLFYTELNTSVMEACEGLSYNLLIASTFYKDNKLTFSDFLRSDMLDGILSYGDIDHSVQSELTALNIPIIVLDSSRRSNELCFSVQVDYEHAAYTATKHLLDLGHEDIAFIGNNKQHDFNLLVFEGFRRATLNANIALGANRIQLNVYDEESLGSCIDEALSGPQLPTALFCATDFYAMRALRKLYHKGIRVPEDISVIGIDDVLSSKYLIPSLTTMAVNRQEMGRLGIDLLQKAINGEPCKSIVLPRCELIVRESTAPPRRA
jgi:DNA-binding LacI/PurR family transcriptional regulator